MTPQMLDAANRLSMALRKENEALAGLDLMHAVTLLGEKTDAVERFTAALNQPGMALVDPQTTVGVAHRLRDLADLNRQLLDRAIQVQSRVIGTIRQAAIRPGVSQRYRRGGRQETAPVRPMSMLTDV